MASTDVIAKEIEKDVDQGPGETRRVYLSSLSRARVFGTPALLFLDPIALML